MTGGAKEKDAAGLARFYHTVSVTEDAENSEPAFGVRLDDRALRTPLKNALALPTHPLAEAVADEWRRQGERIDPHDMPMTRLANTVRDRVTGRLPQVVDDVVSFAGTDLLCYRADGPEELCERQAAHWDPVLAWAAAELGARLKLSQGIVHVQQPSESLERIRIALETGDAFALTPLHVITTLTGSALLAIAHWRGALSAERAWTAAHVDEDWQIEKWGPDSEAAARRALRRQEMDAACRFLALL